jgi:hypothetical protein
MTTVINNPGNGDGSGSSIGLLLGIIVILAAAGLFFVYGLPALQNATAPKSGAIDINVTLPTGGAEPAPNQ